MYYFVALYTAIIKHYRKRLKNGVKETPKKPVFANKATEVAKKSNLLAGLSSKEINAIIN
jgi:hypothetical protein